MKMVNWGSVEMPVMMVTHRQDSLGSTVTQDSKERKAMKGEHKQDSKDSKERPVMKARHSLVTQD